MAVVSRDAAPHSPAPRASRRTPRPRDPPLVKWIIIGIGAVASSPLFLLLPLLAVFVEAFKQGLGSLPRGASSNPTRCLRSA